MKSLRYLNSILTVLALLLALSVWTTWTASPSLATTAVAQNGIPDAGAQRKEMIELLKKLNVQMDQLASLLKSGQVRVHADATADDKK